MKFTVIVASNNPGVLQSCLLASPDLKDGIEIIVEAGALSAGAAYNAGVRKATGGRSPDPSCIRTFSYQPVGSNN